MKVRTNEVPVRAIDVEPAAGVIDVIVSVAHDAFTGFVHTAEPVPDEHVPISWHTSDAVHVNPTHLSTHAPAESHVPVTPAHASPEFASGVEHTPVCGEHVPRG